MGFGDWGCQLYEVKFDIAFQKPCVLWGLVIEHVNFTRQSWISLFIKHVFYMVWWLRMSTLRGKVEYHCKSGNKMERKWRQHGDQKETKWIQNGGKNGDKMETKWRAEDQSGPGWGPGATKIHSGKKHSQKWWSVAPTWGLCQYRVMFLWLFQGPPTPNACFFLDVCVLGRGGWE